MFTKRKINEVELVISQALRNLKLRSQARFTAGEEVNQRKPDPAAGNAYLAIGTEHSRLVISQYSQHYRHLHGSVDYLSSA